MMTISQNSNLVSIFTFDKSNFCNILVLTFQNLMFKHYFFKTHKFYLCFYSSERIIIHQKNYRSFCKNPAQQLDRPNSPLSLAQRSISTHYEIELYVTINTPNTQIYVEYALSFLHPSFRSPARQPAAPGKTTTPQKSPLRPPPLARVCGKTHSPFAPQ